jgi:hypothetical protein
METTSGIAGLEQPLREEEASTETVNPKSPRYRTRSTTRSSSFSVHSSKPASQESDFKLHFSDNEMNNSSSSRESDVVFISPGIVRKDLENPFSPVLDASEAELSPIAKFRDSDESFLETPVKQNAILSPAADDKLKGGERKEARDQAQPTHETASSQRIDFMTENLTVDTSGHEQECIMMTDLTSARNQVGKSSSEFIERIRNAAHRRKVAMTRSRDSLVAKEEEQLRSNAEMKSHANDNAVTKPQNKMSLAKQTTDSFATEGTSKQFKARPLPSTTGALGSGGLEGVPKVEKKPTTTPFSPLLGARRPQKPKIKALQKPKPKECPTPVAFSPKKSVVPALRPLKSKEPEIRPFKARAIPKAIRSSENRGQHGIPKVEKRPLTLAMSPLLGPRRRSHSAHARPPAPSTNGPIECGRSSHLTRSSSIASRTSRGSESTYRSHPMTADSPLLLGLKLVKTPTGQSVAESENIPPSITNSQSLGGYEPYSTRRAKARAEYDIRRKTMFELKAARELQEREREVRNIQRDLCILRKEL